MHRKIANDTQADRRQLVLVGGTYLERLEASAAAVETAPADKRAAHRATAETIREHGTDRAKVLLDLFAAYNEAFFGGSLAAPLVLITSPGAARCFADYTTRDEHGLESRIRIAPRIFKIGANFVADVLLHEMVHAYVEEVLHVNEQGYRGHGPVFAGLCNEIGRKLGLSEVGVKGRAGLPDCAQWPLNVRPEGYYPTPWQKAPKAPKAKQGDGEPADRDDAPADDGRDARKAQSLVEMRDRLAGMGMIDRDEVAALDSAIRKLRGR